MSDMFMLSRIADSLFWLHRYMERADGLILTLRNTYILSFDKDLYGTHGYRPLLQTYTVADDALMDELENDIPALLKYVVCESSNVNSMKTLVGKARENARGSQDKITKELWEQVNAMYHYLQSVEMPNRLQEPQALACLDHLQQQCLLYNGVVDST
ncbi:MAG TPA: alpha-E domain-containing protein, partial [Phnomibacter sp.]|nr:alpha-E domain-containing protein [Phnomibacter sp.]